MKNQKHNVPLVFIHGAWCGKWIWQENFIPFFEGRGYRCVAMDLRGHGKSEGKENLKKYVMDDYAEDVRSVVDSIGGNAVLIGHSLGGGVAEKMIARGPAVAAVLITPVPPQGAIVLYNKLMKAYPGKMLRVLLTKNMYNLVKDPKVSKRIFFMEKTSDDEFKVGYNQLQNESFASGMELKKPTITGDPNPYKVPLLLIGANQDWCFGPEEIRKAGEIYGVKPVFFDDGHALMIEKCWEDVAKTVDVWLLSKGL
jgi:pimeloyl-ACP methyl ester carboxylesterase